MTELMMINKMKRPVGSVDHSFNSLARAHNSDQDLDFLASCHQDSLNFNSPTAQGKALSIKGDVSVASLF